MPRIRLKHKSPEYADDDSKLIERQCDMPGCQNKGDHKAPKHRGLNDYYYFCFEHVKEYNRAWDFFSGMSETEIQDHILKSMYGDRPTWRYDAKVDMEEKLYESAKKEYFYEEYNQENEQSYKKYENDPSSGNSNSSTPEHEALAIMGISPPTSIHEIKARYKKLAKKYHPDLNRDDPKAEELLKKINMAYTILKLAFQEFSQIDKRST